MTKASKDRCVAKLGEPYKMYECGAECEYLSAGKKGNTFSGWHHVDQSITHNAVPKRMVY